MTTFPPLMGSEDAMPVTQAMARWGPSGRRGVARMRGFTLLETLATMMIVALLTVVIVSRTDTTGPTVVGEAQVLRGHLRYIQCLAMANNTAAWSLNVGAGSYTMMRNGAIAPINLPDESSPTHRLPAGVSIVQGAGVLSIDEWGAPAQTRTLAVSDGATRHDVTILGLTGLIR